METLPADAEEDRAVIKPDHVHLDCVTMGLGCGCLQVRPRIFIVIVSFLHVSLKKVVSGEEISRKSQK